MYLTASYSMLANTVKYENEYQDLSLLQYHLDLMKRYQQYNIQIKIEGIATNKLTEFVEKSLQDIKTKYAILIPEVILLATWTALHKTQISAPEIELLRTMLPNTQMMNIENQGVLSTITVFIILKEYFQQEKINSAVCLAIDQYSVKHDQQSKAFVDRQYGALLLLLTKQNWNQKNISIIDVKILQFMMNDTLLMKKIAQLFHQHGISSMNVHCICKKSTFANKTHFDTFYKKFKNISFVENYYGTAVGYAWFDLLQKGKFTSKQEYALFVEKDPESSAVGLILCRLKPINTKGLV